jgi:hypothetical protein
MLAGNFVDIVLTDLAIRSGRADARQSLGARRMVELIDLVTLSPLRG